MQRPVDSLRRVTPQIHFSVNMEGSLVDIVAVGYHNRTSDDILYKLSLSNGRYFDLYFDEQIGIHDELLGFDWTAYDEEDELVFSGPVLGKALERGLRQES